MTQHYRFARLASSALLSVLSVLLPSSGIRAQTVATGQNYAGFDFGATGSEFRGNQNFLWDLIQPDDKTLHTYLPFSNLGSGIGILGGLKVGVAASSAFDVETKLRLQTNHTSRQENFTNLVLDPTDPQQRNLQTDGFSNYSLTQTSIDLGLMFHYRLTDNLYAAAGADYGTFIANKLSLHQVITSHSNPWYIRTNTHNQSFINTLDNPPADLTGYLAQVRGSVQVGAGGVMRTNSRSMLLDVELLLSIPFTEWMSNIGKGHLNETAVAYSQPAITYPRMWYASLTIGLRFPFKKLSAREIEYPDEQVDSPVVVTMHGTTDTASPKGAATVPGATLSGKVTNAKTGAAVGATLTAVDLATNEVVATAHTDSAGNYQVHVSGPGKYSITAEAPGYLFGTAEFEVDAQGRLLNAHPNIMLSEVSNGRTRLLVFFEFGKADLQNSSTPELMRAVQLMKAIPTMRVEIAGYTDTVGTREYNLDLSLRRAEAVRSFLLQNGIQPNRVTSRGYGTDSPIATNETEEGRATNRRVEFVVEAK